MGISDNVNHNKIILPPYGNIPGTSNCEETSGWNQNTLEGLYSPPSFLIARTVE